MRLRKLEMEKRDHERVKRMAEEAKQRQIANDAKRKEADKRIMAALEQNAELLRRKRQAYEQREAEAAQRRKELDEVSSLPAPFSGHAAAARSPHAARATRALLPCPPATHMQIHAREEQRKREEELRKQRERHEKYMGALATEEMRKQSIKSRADQKDQMLAQLYAQRKKEHDLKRVDQEFQLKLRLDKVDAIQKTSLYQRQQLLGRIMNDYDRTRNMLRERQDLQEQRKMANMHASLQRQAMAQAMDSLKFSKSIGSVRASWGALGLPGLVIPPSCRRKPTRLFLAPDLDRGAGQHQRAAGQDAPRHRLVITAWRDALLSGTFGRPARHLSCTATVWGRGCDWSAPCKNCATGKGTVHH